MRWDSPFVLALTGTLAIHTILAVAGDAIVLTHPLYLAPPTPHVDLIDVELPPVVKPPPPPVVPPPVALEQPPPPPVATTHPRAIRTVQPPEPAPLPLPSPPTPDPPSGGDPVVAMPDVAPSATGVGVAVGTTASRIGRSGSDGGTGAGIGPGSAAEPPKPVSVATIKTRAMPRGDYGYFETKDYPAEARQLGIEGAIRVRLIVDEHGKVRSTSLLNRLGHGLDELALHRAGTIEFDPARDSDDRAVSSVVVWTFTMTLPK